MTSRPTSRGVIELPLGPPGRPFVGHLPDLRRDLLGFFTRCAREHGDVVPLRFGPRRAILFNHPAHIEEILITRHRDFVKSDAFRILSRVVGQGLVTSEGEVWLRQRRLVQPAFHRDHIAAYAVTMRDMTLDMLAGWRHGEVRDVHSELTGLTLGIVSRTLFGADVDRDATRVGTAVTIALARAAAILNTVEFLLPAWVPTPNNVVLHRSVREIDQVIYRIIAARRSGAPGGTDLLGMLLAAGDAQGGMSDRQLRDELVTFFLAGHETTAVALAWTLWLLSQHPDARDRLERELDAASGDADPTVADVTHLRYDDMVLSEALRMYPPASLLGREAVRDTQIGGYRIARSDTIVISPWTVHRDGRWFERPEEFRPERWTPELAAALPKFAYFPFGGGPRGCVGAGFAKMEATILLSLIAKRFRLELMPDQEVVPEPSITLRPKYGLRMRLRERAR